jgi:hypothetical protein
MKEPRSAPDIRGVRLEATIRKALADAWALGVPEPEANSMVIRMVQEKFPKEPRREISKLLERMRGKLA